jgi:hypothetical protein
VWIDFGPVIALADTVALKMGALHDRALPRDVLDAHEVKAWALSWSTEIGLDIAESESWSDDEDY